MKYINSIMISLLLLGCSTNNIDYTLARMAGNKPAQFFKFATSHDANDYMFHHKDFDMLMPQTKEVDWTDMGGWNGAYIYGGIGIGLEISEIKKYGDILGYGINMTSSIMRYTDREREIEAHNVQYIKKHTRLDQGDILTIEDYGKENYPCVVIQTYNAQRGIKEKICDCYKFNPERTMVKSVVVNFIYTKSQKLPEIYQHLMQEYTYEDLQNRGKRVLDSLYIKDGWEK